jgi:hemerythrin-like metal-binding protein
VFAEVLTMGIPEFGPELMTGQEDIDEQHRLMFDAAHKVLALERGEPSALFKAVRFLMAYVHHHFQAEEAAMAATDYDRREHHMRQHALLHREVREIRDKMAAGEDPRPLIARVQVLFQDGFVFHIREVDAAFARFLRAHNGQAPQPVELPPLSDLLEPE